MKKVLLFLLVLLRLFIIGKVLFLLYKTQIDPDNYPMDTLTWWIYYLVFDIWIVTTIKPVELTDEN